MLQIGLYILIAIVVIIIIALLAGVIFWAWSTIKEIWEVYKESN